MRRIRIAVLATALVVAGAVGCTNPPDGGGGGGGGGRPTVVMVHGFTAEAAPNWAVMGPGLAAAGFRTVTFRYSSLTIGAELAAAELAARVRTISGPVALLGHSEGGLVTKTCIVLGGCAGRISHWFNISGVNNGTLISAGIPGNALGDMGTTSLLVNRLKANNDKFRSQNIKCHVAYTLTDGLVYPPTASLEPQLGCGSTNVAGSTHFTIIMDPRTVQAAIRLFNS
jgi:triacylglycerol esterase/lipase EstA (alpha/beta hydrolase family)